MARDSRWRAMLFAAAAVSLITGCAGVTIGQPTAVPSGRRLDVPQPTATQIGVGANPAPSAPRMNTVVAQVKAPSGHAPPNAYGWLENVHSPRTRHWIATENRASSKALAALPARAWIGRRLGQLESAGPHASFNDVVVERASYVGPDGTRLPMEIAHRRDLARDGNRPTLLTVYRAAGKPGRLLDPFALVWVQMGGVYARAEVREGLAAAAASPAAGTLPDRSIALSDLFAAGQSLIDRHYTRRARLGIYGRGFSGLMAGTAVTLRPDFFGAALPTGTRPQYLQIASGNCFPPTMVVTADHAGNIRPWEGYELAAVLQAEQICRHPILLQADGEGGPAEPLAVRRQRSADELAFAAKWLGARPAR